MQQQHDDDEDDRIHLAISFRGKKVNLSIPNFSTTNSTVGFIKSHLVDSVRDGSPSPHHPKLQSTHIKLLYNGKVLRNDNDDIRTILLPGKPTYKLLALGMSQNEIQTMNQDLEAGVEKNARLIRDDLTKQGQENMKQRKRLGQRMMQQAAAKQNHVSSLSSSSYGFGTIETLPNLPDQDKARQILMTLANDPGILACMKKHNWRVGSLAEMYPDGKVGEDPVCVLGLNRNKGQHILLRIRTDDLKGFRKMLSIRQVLYHELAHNVHGPHDGKFFQLMRQIESECLQMDWTQGAGLMEIDAEDDEGMHGVTGGSYRLGDQVSSSSSSLPQVESNLSTRERAARAALNRMTQSSQSPASTTATPRRDSKCNCGRETGMFFPTQDNKDCHGKDA